jgi:hypothetical protein
MTEGVASISTKQGGKAARRQGGKEHNSSQAIEEIKTGRKGYEDDTM